MHYWTGLYQEEAQQAMREGIELMLRAAVKLLGKLAKIPRAMLQDSRDEVANLMRITKLMVLEECKMAVESEVAVWRKVELGCCG
jgi:hypothetical protein